MTAARSVAGPVPTRLRGRRTDLRDDAVLVVPPRGLVVLAGLPSAGKTTLLRRRTASRPPAVRPLDAEEVAERLRAGARQVPYLVLRPAVDALHLLGVLREVRGPAACVLTTDPTTSPVRRALLLGAARGSGRSLSVVLVLPRRAAACTARVVVDPAGLSLRRPRLRAA